MSAPNAITIAGNLTADPDVRTTSSEVPLTRFRIGVNRRVPVGREGAWEDRFDGFFTVVCWREMARHAAASLRKGDRVVVTGRLQRREYEATVGEAVETRSVVEIEADEVGASLRWAPVQRLEPRPLEPSGANGATHDPADDPAQDHSDDHTDGAPAVAPAA